MKNLLEIKEKLNLKIVTQVFRVMICTAFTLTVSSCEMVNEDLKPCAPANHIYTIVDFEYRYNMSGNETGMYQDWFNIHAGSAYLYVFDEDETFLFRKEKNKVSMNPNEIDFSIWMDETEIIPGKTYKFVAMAQGNHAGYEASLSTPGFQIPLEHEMEPGVSKISDYRIKLDRDNDGIYDFGVMTDDYGVFNYKPEYADNQKLKLDTIWSTKPNCIIEKTIPEFTYEPTYEIIPDELVYLTIPMMRITNSIKVNLVYEGFTEETNVEDYNFLIDFPNGNGTIGFTGETYPAQELIYLSLRKQMTPYRYKEAGAQYYDTYVNSASEAIKGTGITNTKAGQVYCVNAEFGVSRLQVNDGAVLKILDGYTKEEIIKIENFSDWLASYFDHGYDDDQEFLDREYDYTLDVHVDSDGHKYWLQAGVGILGWGSRKQYVDW